MKSPKSDARYAWGAAVFSAVVTIIFFAIWPTRYVYDDGGIVLRYLDNFARGGFFQYNLDSDPVFGLSGFLYGLLAGGLSATRIISPDAAAFVVNGLGVAATSTFLLLILRGVTTSWILRATAWIYVMAASSYFASTAWQALEAPQHLAVVLACVWAFHEKRRRTFWALAATCIISKLDAAGIVAILTLLRAAELLLDRASVRTWLDEVRTAALWGGIPLLAWLALTFGVFGGPIPQSAYAKMNFTERPDSPWYFVQAWWRLEERAILVHLVVSAFGLGLVSGLRDRERILRILAPLLGSLVLVVMFSEFNPTERMPWYYVLPQTLFVLAAVNALITVFERLTPRVVATVAVSLILVAGANERWETMSKVVRNAVAYIDRAEPERIAVGKFVAAHAAPGDRVYTGHGHTARHSGIHVHDYSGLNSPEVTDLRSAGKGPLATLRPEWLIRPGILPPRDQRELGYRVAGSFYARARHGAVSWRVFHLDPAAPITHPIAPEEIDGAERVEKRSQAALGVRFRREVDLVSRVDDVHGLVFATRREGSAFGLEIVVADSVVAHDTVPARDPEDPVHGLTWETRVDLSGIDAHDGIRIRTVGRDDAESMLHEPVWLTDPTL